MFPIKHKFFITNVNVLIKSQFLLKVRKCHKI